MSKVFFTTLLLLIFFQNQAYAQYEWFSSYHGTSDVILGKSALGSDGKSLYTTGNFVNGIILGDTTIQGEGGFLLKHNLDGELLWYKIFRYSNSEFMAMGQVETDGLGNIYMVGQMAGTMTILAPDTSITASTPSSFLGKFNSVGDLLWIKTFNYSQELFQLSANHNGYVTVTGSVISTPLFIDSLQLQSSSWGFFIALFSPTGKLQWAKLLESANGTTNFPVAMVIDQNNTCFFMGRYSGSFQLDEYLVTRDVNASKHYNMYLTRINQNGNIDWLTQISRSVASVYDQATNPPSGLITEFGDLAIDKDGGIYSIGYMHTSIKIGDRKLVSRINNPEVPDSYIAKFNTDGSLVSLSPLLDNPEYDTAENIVITTNNVIVSGIKNSNPFLLLFPTDGISASQRLSFPIYQDIHNGLVANEAEEVFMSGRYRENGIEHFNGYLAKVDFAIRAPYSITTRDTICPQDTIHATIQGVPKATKYEWLITTDGKEYYETTLNPELFWLKPDIADEFIITLKVRATNDLEKSEYSPVSVVTIEKPLEEAPLVSRESCNTFFVQGANNFKWYKDGEILPEIEQNQLRVELEIPGEYYVIEEGACNSIQSNVLNFDPSATDKITVPNVITPNHDEINDEFCIQPLTEGISLRIFSRWGKEVFMATNYQNNWSGNELPAGVYYYYVNHRCLYTPIIGPLTILR